MGGERTEGEGKGGDRKGGDGEGKGGERREERGRRGGGKGKREGDGPLTQIPGSAPVCLVLSCTFFITLHC